MPNIIKKKNQVKDVKTSGKPLKAEPLASGKSKVSFKPRQLTLLRKDMKRDEHGEWYHTPTVTLAGQWLYDAGFRSGQRIELVIENRQIFIKVVSEEWECIPRKQPDIPWKQPDYYLILPNLSKPVAQTHKVKEYAHRKRKNIVADR